MARYAQGDFVEVEFFDEASGDREWMWVEVDYADDSERIIFGRLDNEPIASPNLSLAMELAISYDKVREHMKPSSFNQ